MDAGTAEFVKSGFLAAVPFARHLGIGFVEVEHGRVVMRLPENANHHNHIGGPHTGAMFTLAESASGAIIIGDFGDQLDRAVPFPSRVEVDFLQIALGDVIAEATLTHPREQVVAELDAGERPEFPIEVELRTEDGTVTGKMTVTWTLKPNRG
ncbi:DUF4442 domain-containing protein [Nocardiopsis listeri]|uniref:DUF4442 domain-containing protein n=1 Tax=Nocardiopsis listeri TaxID=53440 RepID=UPI000835D873|nr:DUF4442 domain-containing protein [Nocardiopsis listeri]